MPLRLAATDFGSGRRLRSLHVCSVPASIGGRSPAPRGAPPGFLTFDLAITAPRLGRRGCPTRNGRGPAGHPSAPAASTMPPCWGIQHGGKVRDADRPASSRRDSSAGHRLYRPAAQSAKPVANPRHAGVVFAASSGPPNGLSCSPVPFPTPPSALFCWQNLVIVERRPLAPDLSDFRARLPPHYMLPRPPAGPCLSGTGIVRACARSTTSNPEHEPEIGGFSEAEIIRLDGSAGHWVHADSRKPSCRPSPPSLSGAA